MLLFMCTLPIAMPLILKEAPYSGMLNDFTALCPLCSVTCSIYSVCRPWDHLRVQKQNTCVAPCYRTILERRALCGVRCALCGVRCVVCACFRVRERVLCSPHQTDIRGCAKGHSGHGPRMTAVTQWHSGDTQVTLATLEC